MWGENPQVIALVGWLEATPAHAFLYSFTQDQPLALVTVQTAHLLGIGVVVSAAWLLGLWLMGVAALPKALGASPRTLIGGAYAALAVLAATGALLIVRRPDRVLLSEAFPIKMGLIVLGLAGLIALSRSLKGDMLFWERTPGRNTAARGAGLVVLLVWSAAVFAGRWIPFS